MSFWQWLHQFEFEDYLRRKRRSRLCVCSISKSGEFMPQEFISVPGGSDMVLAKKMHLQVIKKIFSK